MGSWGKSAGWLPQPRGLNYNAQRVEGDVALESTAISSPSLLGSARTRRRGISCKVPGRAQRGYSADRPLSVQTRAATVAQLALWRRTG